MNFNKCYPQPSVPITPSWRMDFLVGLILGVLIYYKLYFQKQYLYSQVGGENKSIGTGYKHNCFSLPVLFKYKLLPKISFVAGPQFDLLIKAKEKINDGITDTTHETEERNIGTTTGVGFKLGNDLSLNARFMHCLNHIGIT
ncbi:outer membrane beta-barrel protein [Adhaeribacter radiodurans]|uniref:PorT family protein n=1 Tax=Adhaeribacter radiodurans TaxID=2745197 RepID=A0A7L7L3T6_9BACT|nr:outer membrane beta-barrel protein [Adhaeribacter radiodurans]QMU27440.1 PorT family protein [Adhaeribacter radiodurans]